MSLADGQLFIDMWDHQVPTKKLIYPYEASVGHNNSLPGIVSVNGNALLLSDVMLVPDFVQSVFMIILKVFSKVKFSAL